MGWLERLAVAVAMTALGMASATPASADLYGLVVGIDDYPGDSADLEGSRNDAEDIAGALEAAGARSIVKLLDGQVTRAALTGAFDQIVAKANTGDTLVFSFSGHGAQEPEPAGRDGEADGKNEVFLLAGYQTSGVGTRERLVDDEIFLLMQKADAKGIRTVFLADSCHSGTMNRGVATKTLRYRQADFGPITDDLLDFPPPEAATMQDSDLEYATFVSATTDNKLTPEVLIDGKPRGALSWSFARALEGHADRDRDGVVTQFELIAFLVPSVASLVESQQTPQVSPLRPEGTALFNVNLDAAPMLLATAAAATGFIREADSEPLGVAIVGGEAEGLSGLPFVKVVEEAKADLVWNAGTGTIEHRIGGKVAEGVAVDGVRGVVAKFATLKWLKANAAFNPVDARVVSGDQRYAVGATVEISITGAQLPYLTAFNLPPDGRVEFFIPSTAQEAQKDWRKDGVKESFKVDKPPYGAEQLVAIFSDEPLNGLHSVLQLMDTATKAEPLQGVLADALKGRKFQIGVLDIYTGS